jgi:hypothetical protein
VSITKIEVSNFVCIVKLLPWMRDGSPVVSTHMSSADKHVYSCSRGSCPQGNALQESLSQGDAVHSELLPQAHVTEVTCKHSTLVTLRGKNFNRQHKRRENGKTQSQWHTTQKLVSRFGNGIRRCRR